MVALDDKQLKSAKSISFCQYYMYMDVRTVYTDMLRVEHKTVIIAFLFYTKLQLFSAKPVM